MQHSFTILSLYQRLNTEETKLRFYIPPKISKFPSNQLYLKTFQLLFFIHLLKRLIRQPRVSSVFKLVLLGSLGARVSERRTPTGREHFACKDGIVSHIFILLISNREKILRNVNVVVLGQVKSENSSLPVAVRVLKMRMLKGGET